MLNDHLWRSNEILGIGCAQRSKVSNLGLFFSVFTKNSCRSMPVESVYSWLESSQKGEHVNDVHCFSLKSYHITQHNAPLDSILCGIFSSFSSLLALLSLSSSLAVRGDSSLSNVWESLTWSPSCGVKINTTLMEQNNESTFHNTTPISQWK